MRIPVRLRRFGTLALMLGACLLGASCRRSQPVVLRVGVDNAAPYHVVKEDGSVEGMAVDVFTAAARRRNIRIEWVPFLNSTIQRALESGRIDVWPAVSRTPERDREFHFTGPWIQSDYYLVTRRGSAHQKPAAYDRKLAVANYARISIVAARFFPHASPEITKGHAEALQLFCAGKADGALLDARALDNVLLNRPEGCGSVALNLELIPDASNPVSIASTRAAAARADSLYVGMMELARDGGMYGPIDKWAGFTAASTRSFFALRESENRRKVYLFGFGVVTVYCIGLGWAIIRLRRAEKRTALAQHAAADSEARFQAFMDNSPLVGFIKDEHGRMVYMNRRFLDVVGRTAEECSGKDDFALWPPKIAAELRRNDRHTLEVGEPAEFVEHTPGANGENAIWLSLKFPFRQGSRMYLGGLTVDITERERAKESLEISEERFRSLFSHATVGIAIADQHGRLIRVNAAFCRILRLDESAVIDGCVRSLLDDGQGISPELLRQRAAEGTTFESRHRRHGSTLWTENCLFSVRDSAGDAVNIVAIVEDITARKIAEEQLDYQARHDLLTGLTNRRVHEAHLQQQLGRALDGGRKLCLMYVDLDDFKLLNDTMGHEAGDLLLREAAARLSSLVSDEHCLSRIGGDEFVLVQDVSSREDAIALSLRLQFAMEQPFRIHGQSVELRASAGFSIYPDDGLDARTLRKKADDAMYAAKRSEKSRRRLRRQYANDELKAISAVQ